AIELKKQYKKYKEAKRHKQERLGGNNLNKNNTNKEQNIKSTEGLDVLVQDIAAGENVEMLSQENKSLKTLLEKDRNKENQQEVPNNTIQQTEMSTDLQQNRPDDQLDLKEVNQQIQKLRRAQV
ncbi:8750_t:CDS:1, partial [Racocetra fulgida]